jgi:hypothetical protein
VDRRNDDLLLDDSLSGDTVAALSVSRQKSLVSDAPALAARLLKGDAEDRADASIVFNSVAQVMANGLKDHDDDLFSQGIASLVAIWKNGNYEALYPTDPPVFEASLWENLGINLYALGGLAVSGERWERVRELTNQAPTGGQSENSWLRQGQVISARANNEYPEDSMLRLAMRRVRAMRPDMSETEAFQFLTHFDLLSGLIISEDNPRGSYPNAAEFSENLVEPLVIDGLRHEHSPLREHVFKDNTPGLVKALAAYDQGARLQAALARRHDRVWKWRGFSDARTLVFLAEEHVLEEWETASPPRRR